INTSCQRPQLPVLLFEEVSQYPCQTDEELLDISFVPVQMGLRVRSAVIHIDMTANMSLFSFKTGTATIVRSCDVARKWASVRPKRLTRSNPAAAASDGWL